MKKYILSMIVLCMTFVVLSNVSAFSPGEMGIHVNVLNNSINIRGYNVITQPFTNILGPAPLDTFLNQTIAGINSGVTCEPIIVPRILNGTYTGFNDTVNPTCSFYANYDIYSPFAGTGTNSTNQTQVGFVDMITQGKLDTCKDELASANARYQITYEQYSSINKTNDLYVKCNADLAVCNNKPSLQPEIDALKKEKDDNKNQVFIYGAIGLALGILGTLYFKGHIGGAKTKSPESNYNMGQSA